MEPSSAGEETVATTHAVEGAALALESVDDVQGGNGLPLGVLSVCDGITDDTFEEGLENTTGLLVDHSGDTLDTTTTCETTDRGLGDTLDVVTKDLAVTLGSALSESLEREEDGCVSEGGREAERAEEEAGDMRDTPFLPFLVRTW